MEILNLKEIENYKEKMLIFLKKIDNLFKIPLHKKVNIEEYVNKIISLAEVYIMYKENEIIAGVVFYTNNLSEKKAYISLVGVLEDYQNKGIGKKIFKEVLKRIKRNKLKQVGIHTDNKYALKIYKSLNFYIISEENGRYYLEKNLEED